MPALSTIARADPVHCGIFSLISLGFLVSMLGLAAIPVGDIRFELKPVEVNINVTYPTSSLDWKGEQIRVEFSKGVAVAEYTYNKTSYLYVKREVTREWGTYTPGLKLSFPVNFYQPINEWKVVPEEMPLMWIAPMWCFLTGLLTLLASAYQKRDLLLNALVLVAVSASLLLIAAHRVVELTHFCSECDSMTKYISDDGKHLGKLPDGAEDPDLFADNNCPEILHLKCAKGRDVYLAGGVINLICLYLMFATIETRRYFLQQKSGLASQDEMRTK